MPSIQQKSPVCKPLFAQNWRQSACRASPSGFSPRSMLKKHLQPWKVRTDQHTTAQRRPSPCEAEYDFLKFDNRLVIDKPLDLAWCVVLASIAVNNRILKKLEVKIRHATCAADCKRSFCPDNCGKASPQGAGFSEARYASVSHESKRSLDCRQELVIGFKGFEVWIVFFDLLCASEQKTFSACANHRKVIVTVAACDGFVANRLQGFDRGQL